MSSLELRKRMMATEIKAKSYDFVPLLYKPQVDGYDDEGVELFTTDVYDLNTAEVNIIEKLNSAKLKDKAAGVTFVNTATSISITTNGKIIYYETVDNVEQKYKFNGTTTIIPESGSTKRYALIYNTLTQVTIGAGVECIAAVVTVNFDKTNLKQYYYIKEAKELPKWVAWGADNVIIYPSEMLRLDAWARYANYAQVVLPKNLESIPAGTMYNMRLNKGTHIIPESVSSIGANNYNIGCGVKLFIKSNVFFRWFKLGEYSTLSVVRIGENVTDYILDENGYLFYIKGDKKELLWVDAETPIIKIPEGITFLQHSTFMNCKTQNVENIVLPDFLTSVPIFLFSGCTGLTSITLPNSVTSIGDFAFDGCSSLTSITLGNSVTSIGDRAFSGCSSLTSVTLPNSVTSIGNYAFHDCSSLTSITIPDSVTSIGKQAFRDCNYLTSISLKNSRVQKLMSMEFYHCVSLTGIELPDTLEEIDSFSFSNCSSLKYAIFGIKIIKIGNQVFANNIRLTTVVINAEGIPELNATAFTNCPALNSIYVPDDLVDSYKVADVWNKYANIIKPLSEYA